MNSAGGPASREGYIFGLTILILTLGLLKKKGAELMLPWETEAEQLEQC
jgi:hypothetical protein